MHIGRFLTLFSTVLAVFLAVGGPASVSAQAPPDPKQVVDAYERARAAGNLDAALAQFADDAVITVQGRSSKSYAGRDQVRSYLDTVGVRFKTVMRSTPLVQGVTVTWTERDEFPTMALDATVIAIVRSGVISSLIYRDSDPFGFVPDAAGASAPAPPRELPSYAWPAALVLLGTALMTAVFGRPRRRASRSRLNGHLLLALQGRRQDKAA